MNMIHETCKPKSRRERKRLARSQEILSVAMEIVVNEGIDALKMPSLAGRLDCAVGALYRYFPGKAALVVGLQLQAIAAYRDVVDASLAQVSKAHDGAPPVIQLLRSGLLTFVDFAEGNPASFGLIDAMLSDPRALLSDEDAGRVQAVLNEILGRFAALFDEAVEQGALSPGDAMLRTHVVWAALHGASHFRKRDARLPERLAARRVAEACVDTLLSGWKAR
jgi:AcrR family transcriptional regulator